jgi:uncharacterized hydrophobic protein (TIGR00271 family)
MRLLNLESHEREVQVHLMLANRQRGTVEYWTFLLLSMSIATLGLAMDSTTVVIGAMLVSPLMGPIVEFAMGLVVGSPVLTVRSLVRIVGSIVLVVLGAALITLVLPFQEVTSEIAARTEPTLLDLALAVCVALAAALTTVKARSETNIVAAGAAIGIALVPPICVVGFGLGTWDFEVAMGASLLLVTNFSAIIGVGFAFFFLLGYERVSVKAWDDEALAAAAPDSLIRRVLLGVDGVFGSRQSRIFRWLVPLTLLGVLTVPLASGLNRVKWEVQTRSDVGRILDGLSSEYDDFDTSWSVSNGHVVLRTFLVGSSVPAADSLRADLATRIAAATGVEPDVRVTAVPDINALQRALTPTPREVVRVETPPEVELARLRQELSGALDRSWPVGAYGPLMGWHLQLSREGEVALHLQHLGPAPDAGAAQLLAGLLGPRVPSGLGIRFDPVDTTAVRAEVSEARVWLPVLVGAIESARETPSVRVCVELPGAEALAGSAEAMVVAEMAPGLVERLPEGRYGLRAGGEHFVVRLEATGVALAVSSRPNPTAAGDRAAALDAATAGQVQAAGTPGGAGGGTARPGGLATCRPSGVVSPDAAGPTG